MWEFFSPQARFFLKEFFHVFFDIFGNGFNLMCVWKLRGKLCIFTFYKSTSKQKRGESRAKNQSKFSLFIEITFESEMAFYYSRISLLEFKKKLLLWNFILRVFFSKIYYSGISLLEFFEKQVKILFSNQKNQFHFKSKTKIFERKEFTCILYN